MDQNAMEANEIGVDEGAFWHTNMDLYYGYQPGEVVEVEHESNKYWLATIEYSFKHLILLKWIGNYGEFWVETSSSTKRLFPPGHHLQSQLKSQFILEKPTKVLIKPSLYNPANDPYAEIRTVDDLLSHEIEQANTDTFGNQSSVNTGESASLALAKCKTKISYGQEDVDELEAALQNLNEIDSDGVAIRNESPDSFNLNKQSEDKIKSDPPLQSSTVEQGSEAQKISEPNLQETSKSEQGTTNTTSQTILPTLTSTTISNCSTQRKPEVDDEAILQMCKSLQDSAITRGRYLGIDGNSQKVYYLKPKQFFDMGGANHERVFVPGTLVEICHTNEVVVFDCRTYTRGTRLELYHWFATVVKNVGGRLTLRWFLCDEPKFKQGRLELKTCRSEFIVEEEDLENLEEGNEAENRRLLLKGKVAAKDTTFCMHFCNPCIHSISHAHKSKQRAYKMPVILRDLIEDTKSAKELEAITKSQLDHIFDYRRMNLDKDRPIIDHLLSTIRWTRPQYLNISFAPKDKENRREVLLSTPKTTKLLKGFISREIEPGVYEIHSDTNIDSGEKIKFIYPYDSSYSILPMNWAINNQDCLSVHPSRDPTPAPTEKSSSTNNAEMNSSKGSDQSKVSDDEKKIDSTSDMEPNSYPQVSVGPYKLLCEIPVACDASVYDGLCVEVMDLDGKNSTKLEIDEMEPSYWSRLMRSRELSAPEFQCSIDYSSMDKILSRFKVMDQLEVVHPSSDVTICLGRIRKVVYPLLWIQISADSYTLLPFNSTDIYPVRWCETNDHPLISLLPPRKRINYQASSQQDKKRRKTHKTSTEDIDLDNEDNRRETYEKEHFDLGALSDKQLDIDYILNEKSMYIRIFFNHKCFTGPSLSKGKICSLPQYVGPGPLRLVLEEVVTKVISVAYVPPRILNDLSSKSFEDLLIARNLTNTTPLEFKAKYQKRVHREDIPICLNPDDVALYCECLCEHLKCCYNLFGPNLYDGDDCPGHCRALTKSNKFMKRATYYREKARLGEFTNDNGGNKKATNNSNTTSNNNANNNKTSRARYAGRDSSESTSSSLSRTEQLNSRASSAGDDYQINELKENLVAVKEEIGTEGDKRGNCSRVELDTDRPTSSVDILGDNNVKDSEPDVDKNHLSLPEQQREQQLQPNEPSSNNILTCKPSAKLTGINAEFNLVEANQEVSPEGWTVEDVAAHLDGCRLSRFKSYMVSEGVDGQALLLLDKVSIREHFQYQSKSEYSNEEVDRLCRFVEFVKSRAEAVTGMRQSV